MPKDILIFVATFLTAYMSNGILPSIDTVTKTLYEVYFFMCSGDNQEKSFILTFCRNSHFYLYILI